MTDDLRVWQAKIYVGEKMDQPETVYGESLAKLKLAAEKWLLDNKPPKYGQLQGALTNSEIIKRNDIMVLFNERRIK